MSTQRSAAHAGALPASLPAIPAAANDNGCDPDNDAVLRSALRLFAEHGLGAGHRAQAKAEEAYFAGERERYRWWLTVTRVLDRKLAVELTGRMGSDLFGARSQASD